MVAATEVLAGLTQAEFNQLVVRLELDREIPADTNTSVQKKCALLGRIVTSRPENTLETFEGSCTFGEAVVREAVASIRPESAWKPQQIFTQVLAREGYSLTWNVKGEPELRPSLPIELGAEVDDEVVAILSKYHFVTVRGHLKQALDAHSRGDWAAANAQFRTFMESLLNDIASYLRPQKV